MAQSVEHVLGKDEVAGSSPANSSKKTAIFSGFFLYFSTKYSMCQYVRKCPTYICIRIANFFE